MKSFKQKQEEKQKRLDTERLIAEEKAFNIQQQKESDRIEQERLDEIAYNKALLQEQQEQENAIWEERESRKIESEYDLNYKESIDRNKQIDDYRKLKDLELEYRLAQKGTINEILSSEDKVRETISSIERQLEVNEYEDHQLEKIEESEALLEQELAIVKAKQRQERLDKISEQEKLARWDKNEKIESKEKLRMKELRESQEKETNARKAAELQEIISSRKIYELRQKEIAKEQKETREAINEILQEAQFILDSEKASKQKDILSNLHDYIYRLNPNQEKNIWTERKQPKSILTWEDWKQVPANNILLEQDFKRARLLFEQDNQRAQRYHDHMYQNFAARNLTLDRKKAIAADGKLTDISYDKLVTTRKEILSGIGNIQFWLDASDQSSIDAIVTGSAETASITAFWVPDSQIGLNDTHLFQDETHSSASLQVLNADNLFDGSPDTFMTITHTSESYDWHQRNIDASAHDHTAGIYYLRIKLPDDLYTKQVERVELRSIDRKFIPTYITSYNWDPNYGASTELGGYDNTSNRYTRYQSFKITGSFNSSYNATLSAGSEHTSSRMGGVFGITPEGSASLDPFLPFGGIYSTQLRRGSLSDPNELIYEPQYFGNDFIIRVTHNAHFSESRYTGLEIFLQEPSRSISVHGEGIHQWKSQPDPDVHDNARNWKRTKGTNVNPSYNSRQMKMGYPTWYSASYNQPVGYNMPYVQFSSESYSALSSIYEYSDYTKNGGTTQFMVARDTSGKNTYTNLWYGDGGQSYKSSWKVGISGFYKGFLANVTDWPTGAPLTTKNQRHTLQIFQNANAGEKTLYGIPQFEWSSSAWPYIRNENNFATNGINQLIQGMAQTETTILTTQLDNPMTEVSSSRFRLWQKGGTPFVDVDNGPITDYSMTGSYVSEPQLGSRADGEWGDFRLHEMIVFDKVLTTTEIDQVHDYLSDKWKLITFPVRSDKDGDSIIGISSSNSAYDVVTYDGTDRLEGDTIYSSSAWNYS